MGIRTFTQLTGALLLSGLVAMLDMESSTFLLNELTLLTFGKVL